MEFEKLVQRGQIVKIDGLREPEHAAIAAEAGADLVGFIFAPARRQVSADQARRCVEAAKAANANVMAVGVFVDAPLGEMQDAVAEAGLDAVQLHGEEEADASGALGVPTLRAFRPKPGTSANDVLARIDANMAGEAASSVFLIDAYVAGAAGGTGVRADWDLARSVCVQHPVMLAGGLDPSNVSEAIRFVGPLGVDVSSGVEIDGVKDPDLIVSFIREARAALRTLH